MDETWTHFFVQMRPWTKKTKKFVQARPWTKDILVTLGIDPELLGETRRIGLHKRIADAATNGLLSTDVHDDSSNSFEDAVVPAKALIQMRHELAYLRQEVEFIKKILSPDEEMKS